MRGNNGLAWMDIMPGLSASDLNSPLKNSAWLDGHRPLQSSTRWQLFSISRLKCHSFPHHAVTIPASSPIPIDWSGNGLKINLSKSPHWMEMDFYWLGGRSTMMRNSFGKGTQQHRHEKRLKYWKLLSVYWLMRKFNKSHLHSIVFSPNGNSIESDIDERLHYL